jgi:hypothetical protein
MGNFKNYFYKKAGLKAVIIWGAVFLFFNIIVFPVLGNQIDPAGEYNILDLFFGYSMKEAFSVLEGIGEDGRSAHLYATAVADMIYPVIYSVFLSLLIAVLIKKLLSTESCFSYFVFSPFIIMLFDFIENSAIISMLISFPDITETMAKAGSIAGIAKWCSTGFVIIIVIIMVISILTGKITGIKKNDPV